MNKKLIGTVSGFAIAFGAGYITEDLLHVTRVMQNIARGAQNVSSKENDPVMTAPLCYVTNMFATEMQVQVIASKFAGGNRFIQPKEKGIFFCGDKLKIINGKYTTELTIKSSITFEAAKPIKYLTNI